MAHPHTTNKVGLVPYADDGSVRRFLIHLPIAKNPEEQDEMMWGLVRGTVRDRSGNDLRSMDALRATPPGQIEPAWATALHEAEEEAGITPNMLDLSSRIDHGHLDYESLDKPTFQVHFFSARLLKDDLSTLKQQAVDATDLAIKTLPELEAMAQERQFKPGYLPILRQIDRQVTRSMAPSGEHSL